MSFNSFHFAIFFPLVVAVYYVLPARFRLAWLLVSSYYFYMAWVPVYGLLLLFVTIVTYGSALLLGGTKSLIARRMITFISLALMLGVLFWFKYSTFVITNLNILLSRIPIGSPLPLVQVVLPVGISFFTFQALGYILDVHAGRIRAERQLHRVALFISFFPQLVAGPIERAGRLLPQFNTSKTFYPDRIQKGMLQIGVGFFQKLVLADHLAEYVDTVYTMPEHYGGGVIIAATYFFAFQIYFDFWGYSNIAIGCARILGFELACNFNQPYHANSLTDFWRRWHITLSSWFRDYVYIPLGGNKSTPCRGTINVLAVFILSGLWHGAAWTFLLWGGLHGVLLLGERVLNILRNRFMHSRDGYLSFKLRHTLQILITFHLVLAGWMVFRANSITHLKELLNACYHGPYDLRRLAEPVGMMQFSFCLTVLGFVEIASTLHTRVPWYTRLKFAPVWFRWLCYYGLFFSILLFGKFSADNFIYFRF